MVHGTVWKTVPQLKQTCQKNNKYQIPPIFAAISKLCLENYPSTIRSVRRGLLNVLCLKKFNFSNSKKKTITSNIHRGEGHTYGWKEWYEKKSSARKPSLNEHCVNIPLFIHTQLTDRSVLWTPYGLLDYHRQKSPLFGSMTISAHFKKVYFKAVPRIIVCSFDAACPGTSTSTSFHENVTQGSLTTSYMRLQNIGL